MGTSIAVIVGLGTLKAWPELIPACVQGLEGSDTNALEGSLDALFKVNSQRETCITYTLTHDSNAMPVCNCCTDRTNCKRCLFSAVAVIYE